MLVTICDYDAIKEPARFFPNLDVMQLSTYYKYKNHLTYGLFDLEDKVLLNAASKIILRKDRGNSVVPTEFLDRPRVEYGGLGFTNKHHVALPEEAEHMTPDRFFYDTYLTTARMSKRTRTLVGTVLRRPMMRLSIDGVTCNNNWNEVDLGAKKHTVTIFDPNITDLTDSFDILNSLDRRIRTRWALNIRSVDEGLHWSQLPITNDSIFNLFNYDYNDLRTLTPLYDIRQNTYIIVFDHNSSYGTFTKELKQLMKLGIHEKIANRSKLKIWYQPDNFTKPYEHYITHLVDFFNTGFTDISFMENLRTRSLMSIPFWEELARADVELKFLVHLSPVVWRNKGEQLKL